MCFLLIQQQLTHPVIFRLSPPRSLKSFMVINKKNCVSFLIFPVDKQIVTGGIIENRINED